MVGGRGGWKHRQEPGGRGLALGARLRSWVLFSEQWDPWKAFELGKRHDLLCSGYHSGAMGRMKFGERRDQASTEEATAEEVERRGSVETLEDSTGFVD